MKKILLLSANPKNTDALRLNAEVREIQTGLERAKKRDQFEIKPVAALRVADLRRALLKEEPQIVHFCGHGAGEKGLVLENDSGHAQLVTTESLAELFKLFQSQIECVVLNACYSEIQAKAIYESIPCVIGMKQAIGDQAAINFSIGFYDALGSGRAYLDAYAFGCNAINLQGLSESLTPVLMNRMHTQIDSTAVVEPESTKEKPPITMTAGDHAKQVGYIEQVETINF